MKCTYDPPAHRGADGRTHADNVGSGRETDDCLGRKIVTTVVLHSVMLCTRHKPKM